MSLSCDNVMDLVSIYKDKLASEDSIKAIEEHLKQCPECKKYYRQYESISRIATSKYNAQIEDGYMKRYTDLSVKLRTRRILFIIGIALFTAVSLTTMLISLIKLLKNKR